MDYTIHFGTWVIPFFLTVIAFLVAKMTLARDPDPWGMLAVMLYGLAIIGSLICWLVWALFR